MFCCDAGCSSDEYQCPRNGRCMREKYVCLGDTDCTDYYDNVNCPYGKWYNFILVGDRGREGTYLPLPKKMEKIFFGQLLSKIRAFLRAKIM